MHVFVEIEWNQSASEATLVSFPNGDATAHHSQLSFSQAPELVGDGAATLLGRPIVHCLSAEAPADCIDSLVGA
jgi:hypothetical protein